jgi:PAS domain S-box-containing protein
LLKQTRLVGVLYLENNLTPRVFTPARMAVLELIASGAAISLENTRLYGDLQEREAKMRGVVDTALDAVLGIDEQGRVTEWNGQAETMFGWRREEAVGRRLSETLIPMRYRSAHDEGLRRFLTSGEGPILNRRVEMTALRRNGSEFPVELSVAPYRIGGTWAFSGFVRDVTERKRLYKDLQEREAKFRRLVDSNIIGIFIWGPEGRIIDANEAFLRIVGYDRDDLVSGRLRWSEMRPEWSDADDRRVAELKATGTAQPHELEYIQKGGSAVPVLVGAANFEGGRDEGMGFVIDLTDRKKAEAAARESEARYREVQMALAHANRVATMGQLSASIAHEINQPIAAAITYAKAGLRWLRAQPPELEEVREVLSSIVETASRADDVISRVRALFKKEPRGHESLEINEAILEVIALIRSEAAKNGVSVQTELAERLPAVCGDRVQLQQVILNLLINSIDAMSGKSEGPRELLISTKKDDPDGVFVAVQDSGPGFAPESGGRLFEAFYTTKPDGLGMGLSICRSIIEAHEGRLWATANVPQGAIFQFTLPSHPSSKECSLEGA